jgi:hypothetical protein
MLHRWIVGEAVGVVEDAQYQSAPSAENCHR